MTEEEREIVKAAMKQAPASSMIQLHLDIANANGMNAVRVRQVLDKIQAEGYVSAFGTPSTNMASPNAKVWYEAGEKWVETEQ